MTWNLTKTVRDLRFMPAISHHTICLFHGPGHHVVSLIRQQYQPLALPSTIWYEHRSPLSLTW